MKQSEIENIRDNIFADFNNGLNLTAITKKYGIFYPQLNTLFKKYNIKNEQKGARYRFDIHFFDVVDTEEKAYLLGFLYADGYNIETKNTVSLSLHKRDLEILEKILKILKSNRPIIKAKNQLRIDFTHEIFSRALKKLGCVQAKTFKIKFPTKKQVPQHLLNHFVRGYFDGDGCIKSQQTNKKWRKWFDVSIVGTQKFCTSLQILFKKITSVNGHINCRYPERKNNIRQLIYGGNRCVGKILDWLYKDATIFLERKYKRYLELVEINQVPTTKRVLQICPQTNTVIKVFDSVKMAAKFMNSHIESLRVVCGKGFKHKNKNGTIVKYVPKTHKGYIWKYERK